MVLEREDIQLYFFLGLLGVFAGLSFLLVLPYIYYLLGAIVLVYVTYPVYTRLRRAAGSERVAALLAILLLILTAVIPSIYLGNRIVSEGSRVLTDVGVGAVSRLD
ncbi:MAG: hypothetical protein ABEK12_03420, partial [Candidatus Nanohaloarchaea archaeon]